MLEAAEKLYNRSQIQTSIQWIPGHCDIPGNSTTGVRYKPPSNGFLGTATSRETPQPESDTNLHPMDSWALRHPGKLYNRSQIQTSIQWIPGHCDIPRNSTTGVRYKPPSNGFLGTATSRETLQPESDTNLHPMDSWAVRHPEKRRTCSRRKAPTKPNPMKQSHTPQPNR